MTTLFNTRRRTQGVFGLLSVTLILSLSQSASAQCNPAELAKLLESGGTTGSKFGISVAIDGDLAIVGSPRSDAFGNNIGAAHIYKRNNAGIWALEATLGSSDGSLFDGFGSYVSISNNTVVVGSPGSENDAPLAGSDLGAVYVFVHDNNGGWVEQAKLVAADAERFDNFGGVVSISKDTVIVGVWADDDFGPETGSAYIYQRTFDNGTPLWTQQTKLVPPTASQGDLFGISVCVDGDFAVVGSREIGAFDSIPVGTGSAYIYARLPNGAWEQRAHLLASDGVLGDAFGASVSISDDTVAVGAPFDDEIGNDSGSAYIFGTNDGGMTWTEQFEIFPIDGSHGDFFGFPALVDGDTAIIGSTFNDDFGNNSGSAYVYTRIGAAWIQRANILASDGEEGDSFGVSIATSGDQAIIGAHLNDDNGLDSGSAYMFNLNCAICPADITGEGDLNFLDVSAFLAAFGSQDPIADYESDGAFNFLDVSAFLAAFAAGCP